jgi:hypothetical protein
VSLINFPPKPTGNDRESIFMRWVWDSLLTLVRVNDVQGVAMSRTTRGTSMVPVAKSGSGSGRVTPYKLRVVYDDHYVCRSWNGTDIGTSDVLIAKPQELRCSLESSDTYQINTGTLDPEFVAIEYTYEDDEEEPAMVLGDGGTFSGEVSADYEEGGDLFDFRLNTIRTATIGENSEDQQVVPIYLKGDVIFAAETDWTGVEVEGVALKKIEVIPARHWAAIG